MKRQKSDESRSSLPETHYKEVVFPKSPNKDSQFQRLCPQHQAGGRGHHFREARLRQSTRVNGSTVLSSEVGVNYSQLRSLENMVSPKSAVLKQQSQRLKSRQSTRGNLGPKIDKNSNVYIGRNLLFRDNKPDDNKEESQQRKKRIEKKNTGQINQTTLQNTINSDESAFLSPDHNLRSSLLTPNPEIQNSLEQPVDHDSIQEADFCQFSHNEANIIQSYSKQYSFNETQRKSPVKVEESLGHDRSSLSKMTNQYSKNQHNQFASRLSLLESHENELISSFSSFEKQVQDSSLEYDAFVKLVQERKQYLEKIFMKSFSLTSVRSQVPSAVQNFVATIIDGYKDSINAFERFSLRQKQQTDYKIERLSQVNADLHKDMQRRHQYNDFLKKKLENLQEEMTKIDQKIASFNSITVMGQTQAMIQDWFSGVSTHLETIVNDLSQERVPLSLATQDDDTVAMTKKKSSHSNRASPDSPVPKTTRVSTVDFLPFKEIKKQISNNYADVQRNTARALIRNLGLGERNPYEDAYCQTEGKFIEKSIYKAIKVKLCDLLQSLDKKKSQIKLLKQTVQERDQQLEEKKGILKRVKQDFKESQKQYTQASMKIAEQEDQIDKLNQELSLRNSKIDDLNDEIKKLKDLLDQKETRIETLSGSLKDTEHKCESQKKEITELNEEQTFLEDELVFLKDKQDELSQKYDLQNQELITVKTRAEGLNTLNSDLKEEIETIGRCLQISKKELKDVQDELKRILAKYRTLEDDTAQAVQNKPKTLQMPQSQLKKSESKIYKKQPSNRKESKRKVPIELKDDKKQEVKQEVKSGEKQKVKQEEKSGEKSGEKQKVKSGEKQKVQQEVKQEEKSGEKQKAKQQVKQEETEDETEEKKEEEKQMVSQQSQEFLVPQVEIITTKNDSYMQKQSSEGTLGLDFPIIEHRESTQQQPDSQESAQYLIQPTVEVQTFTSDEVRQEIKPVLQEFNVPSRIPTNIQSSVTVSEASEHKEFRKNEDLEVVECTTRGTHMKVNFQNLSIHDSNVSDDSSAEVYDKVQNQKNQKNSKTSKKTDQEERYQTATSLVVRNVTSQTNITGPIIADIKPQADETQAAHGPFLPMKTFSYDKNEPLNLICRERNKSKKHSEQQNSKPQSPTQYIITYDHIITKYLDGVQLNCKKGKLKKGLAFIKPQIKAKNEVKRSENGSLSPKQIVLSSMNHTLELNTNKTELRGDIAKSTMNQQSPMGSKTLHQIKNQGKFSQTLQPDGRFKKNQSLLVVKTMIEELDQSTIRQSSLVDKNSLNSTGRLSAPKKKSQFFEGSTPKQFYFRHREPSKLICSYEPNVAEKELCASNLKVEDNFTPAKLRVPNGSFTPQKYITRSISQTSTLLKK